MGRGSHGSTPVGLWRRMDDLGQARTAGPMKTTKTLGSVAVLTALGLWFLAVPARADTVLPDGQARLLPDPGVSVVAPHDGRIRGYGFSARVTGAALTSTAGTGADSFSAPAGQYLCVFGLAVTDFSGDGSPIPDFAAVGVVGQRRIPL